MVSTTTSEILVESKDVHLTFKTNVYRAWTWKSAFVQAFQHGMNPNVSDSIHVLKGVRFAARKGDRIGILGPNGAGKTTLCRCIAGFFTPTRGAMSLQGEVKAIFNTQQGIQPELTGRENLQLLAHFLFPKQYKDHERLVSEAASFSELGDFLDAPFRIYSTGMQARLVLSLVTARAADVLILDEVFDGADQHFRARIAERVRKMIAESGVVLFVSHSEEQIRSVCNRVIVLREGVVAFDGAVDEGLAYYRELPPPVRQI